MFNEYYGFRENPFGETHDIDFFYLSSSNKQLYRDLLNDIYQRVDLTLLLADWGVGKTAFLQQLIGIDPFEMRVMYFHDTGKWHGLVDYLCSEMKLVTDSHDAEAKEQVLAEHLTEIHQQEIIPVLIVDNAQELEDDSLALLLQLSSRRIEGQPLIQVILASVPAFMARFDLSVLLPYKSSISRQYQIKALTQAEVNEYIHFRLQQAGCNRKDLFSDSAVQMIADRSEGIPRLVNKLCGSALLLASLEDYETVDEEIIDKASKYCFLSPDSAKNGDLDDTFKTNNLADEIIPNPSYTPSFKDGSLDSKTDTKQSYPWSPQLVRFGSVVAVALTLLLAGILLLLKSNPEQPLKEETDIALDGMQSSTVKEETNEKSLPDGQHQKMAQTLVNEAIRNQEVAVPKNQNKIVTSPPPPPPPPPLLPSSSKETQTTVGASNNDRLMSSKALIVDAPAQKSISPSIDSPQLPKETVNNTGRDKLESHPPRLVEKKLAMFNSAGLDEREQQAKSRALARLQLKQSDIEFGIESLMTAAQDADNKTLELLLIAGIPPDIQQQTISLTALAIAAANGHNHTVQLLLSQEASIDLKNYKGRTALMAAAGNGHAETVRVLLNNDAKIDINDHDGWTALMFAAYSNHSETVQVLLEQGANKRLKNSVNRTVLQIARNRGHQDIVKLLTGN